MPCSILVRICLSLSFTVLSVHSSIHLVQIRAWSSLPATFSGNSVSLPACWDDNSQTNTFLVHAACPLRYGRVSYMKVLDARVFAFVRCEQSSLASCRAGTVVSAEHCKHPFSLLTITCQDGPSTTRATTTRRPPRAFTRRQFPTAAGRWWWFRNNVRTTQHVSTTNSWKYISSTTTHHTNTELSLGLGIGIPISVLLASAFVTACCCILRPSRRRLVCEQEPRTPIPAVVYTPGPPESRHLNHTHTREQTPRARSPAVGNTAPAPAVVFTPFSYESRRLGHRQADEQTLRTRTPAVVYTAHRPAPRASDVPRRERVVSLLSPPSYDEALRCSSPSCHPVPVSEDDDPPPSYESVMIVTPK